MTETTIQVKGVNLPKTKLGWHKMNEIVQAAEDLFNDASFFETSVSDICKKAHTAVGTFYIYFDSKTDLYRYLVERYKKEIKTALRQNIQEATTRYEKERAGIKCFVKYAIKTPQVYKIIWGSLAVEEQMFIDYYESFARSYANALSESSDELRLTDIKSLSYCLMGITNFIGLKALFENSTDEEIDAYIDQTVMPLIQNGMFK